MDWIPAQDFFASTTWRRIASRRSPFEHSLEPHVREIVEGVRREGDRALIRYTREFDHVEVTSLKIVPEQLAQLARQADPRFRQALRKARRNIEAFHRRQREKSWMLRRANGVRWGQQIRALHAVGIYVPGGKAAYPSTVLMNAIPAQIAGVKRIVVVTPPKSLAENPALAAALVDLDLKEVYGVGGAQAVAALAYGTETIPRVDKVVGPGNRFVATAKKILYGTIDIDMVAGPTEVVIVADESADPNFIAADLLAQAEHDEEASAICIALNGKLMEDVQTALAAQLERQPRREICAKSLRHFGALIAAKNQAEAIELVNALAPEHVELHVKNPRTMSKQITNAGAIFLGSFSAEVVGDYFAGPNHVLPTQGTARFFSPLGVYDFLKRTSILEYSSRQLARDAASVVALARAEGLHAHAASIEVRVQGSRRAAWRRKAQ